MANEYLDPGVYTNIFPVYLPDKIVDVMIITASAYPCLRELREQIRASSQDIRVYRLEDVVLGYGAHSDWLASKGFRKEQKRLMDYPKWCARLIVEGLVDLLKKQGYREWIGKGRTTLYEPKPLGQAAQRRLSVFRGYNLRSIYWRKEGQPLFGLIVDICWEIQDTNGKRLSSHEIAQYNAMAEIARIQDEFLPGNRINPEVSRLRLQNHILLFVRQNSRFALPCGESIEAALDSMPMRVILGV